MRYHSDMRRSIELDPSFRLVLFTLLAGFLLNMLPYPDHWFVYKPDFVGLVLVYWGLKMRKPFSLTLAFLVGIVMDVAYTAALGQHAFAYIVLLMTVAVFRRPYVIARKLQQVVFVGIALAAAIASSLLVSWFFEDGSIAATHFMPAAVGAGIWLVLPLLASARMLAPQRAA